MKQDIRELLDEGTLSLSLAEYYLNIYVGESDWQKHMVEIWGRIKNTSDAQERMRRIISCTILLPSEEKLVADPPHRLLFGITSFTQFNEKDWFKQLQEVVAHDEEIAQWRMQALGLGVIDPIDFAPNTRQAFNWLYLKAEESGVVTPASKEVIMKRFKNLVIAYGGAVICNIFTRHDDHLKKIVNWRSGYFFERIIYDVYKPQQVLKIKKMELDRTSERLVKRIQIEG